MGFRKGDKVIQTENNSDVFNGDIGIVEKVDAVEQEVTIRFDDRPLKYDFGELDEVSLAYAISIHKSQSSEFPVHAVAAKPNLYGDYAGQAAAGTGGADEGSGHRGSQ